METININKEVKKPRQKVLDPKKLEEQEVYMDKVRALNDAGQRKNTVVLSWAVVRSGAR